jgi:ActR/RegA family two-component response regulator
MAATAPLLTIVLSPDELREQIRAALEPLRVELERLRGEHRPVLVTLDEAARRLGRDRRTIQRWLKQRKDGIEEEWVGGVRMVRLPAEVLPR